MKKARLLLCCLLVLCLCACSVKLVGVAQAQDMIESLRAIPAEELEFVLFNPIPVEGAQYALATEPLVEEWQGYGYDVVTQAGEEHRAAVLAVINSMELTESAIISAPDTGGGNDLWLYRGDALVDSVFVGNGKVYCYFQGLYRFGFSADPEATALLLEAIHRTY